MLIRIGYDIELSVTAPTALIYMLQVHPSRAADMVAPRKHHPQSRLCDRLLPRCLRQPMCAGAGACRRDRGAAAQRGGGLRQRLPDRSTTAPFEHAPADLPVATLLFLLPSRYCEVDSELLAIRLEPVRPRRRWAGTRVQAICDFVHRHLRFDYQRARATRTALEGFRERTGVCRDFTHLAITLCRCMNIPARYVTGYLGDIGVPPVPYPMDFSAWFEVYLGDRWYTFDARHNTPRIGRILIARGRDAADVPITMVFGRQYARPLRSRHRRGVAVGSARRSRSLSVAK